MAFDYYIETAMTSSIITGTGSYIPTIKVSNKQFLGNDFYDANGSKIAKANVDIVNKLFSRQLSNGLPDQLCGSC